MNISELAVVDVRGPLTAQRERLLGLLTSLSAEQWAAPTAAPAWSVKDIAPAAAAHGRPLRHERGQALG
jgi:hypothetical protein